VLGRSLPKLCIALKAVAEASVITVLQPLPELQTLTEDRDHAGGHHSDDRLEKGSYDGQQSARQSAPQPHYDVLQLTPNSATNIPANSIGKAAA
jgi:hypothetical protein